MTPQFEIKGIIVLLVCFFDPLCHLAIFKPLLHPRYNFCKLLHICEPLIDLRAINTARNIKAAAYFLLHKCIQQLGVSVHEV